MVRHFFSFMRIYAFVSTTILILGCARSDPSKELYLDQEFTTLCEAFEAAGQLALRLHVERTESDFSTIRSQAAKELATDWKLDAPSTTTKECADLIQLQAALKKANPKADVSDQQLYRDALGKFISLLDPHSSYLTPGGIKMYETYSKNQGVGIGIAFQTRLIHRWEPMDSLIVKEVFPKSVNADVLQEGDQIISIDGTDVEGKLFREIGDLLRQGTSVEVTLDRNGETQTVTLDRGEYVLPPVRVQHLKREDLSLGYILFRGFTDDSTAAFRSALTKLEDDYDVDGLVLDLRGCPGGQGREASRMVSLFVNAGLVYEARGKKISKPYQRLDANERFGVIKGHTVNKLPLVILIDPASASASEIVAGALRGGSRALLVGERTFGKGTGQQHIRLGDKNGLGGMFLLTMFRYYLFDNSSPQGVGVAPHIRIPNPDVERIVALGKNTSRQPLYEEDYGKQIISPVGGQNALSPSSTLQDVINEIGERKKEGLYENVCDVAPDDCPKELALRWLLAAIHIQPSWPETELDRNSAGLKIRALDRSAEATYRSGHGKKRTSKLAGPTKASLFQR